jgi:spore coat protein U-like protein
MKKSTIIAALAVALAGVSINSYADTNTATFEVTANIDEACAVSASPIAFGAYDPVNAHASASLHGTGTVTTTCTNGTTGSLLLNEGSHKSAGSAIAAPLRNMTTGSGTANELLAYLLYSGGVDTTVWGGDKATGLAVTVGDGTSHGQTVYGTITGGQNLKKVGAYTDTVTVTIDFTGGV